MRIIAVDDSMLAPDDRLELSGNIVLCVLGRETQIRFHKDLRIDWDNAPGVVNASRKSLIKLKRAAGFGVRDRPSAHHVELLIDTPLAQVDSGDRSALPSPSNYVQSDADALEGRQFAEA
jgi:hypothetical protein